MTKMKRMLTAAIAGLMGATMTKGMLRADIRRRWRQRQLHPPSPATTTRPVTCTDAKA